MTRKISGGGTHPKVKVLYSEHRLGKCLDRKFLEEYTEAERAAQSLRAAPGSRRAYDSRDISMGDIMCIESVSDALLHNLPLALAKHRCKGTEMLRP